MDLICDTEDSVTHSAEVNQSSHITGLCILYSENLDKETQREKELRALCFVCMDVFFSFLFTFLAFFHKCIFNNKLKLYRTFLALCTPKKIHILFKFYVLWLSAVWNQTTLHMSKENHFLSDSVTVLRGRTVSQYYDVAEVDRATIKPTRRRVTSLHLRGITSSTVISHFSKDFNRSVYKADGEKIGLADFPIMDDKKKDFSARKTQ